jgi:hypothetical protein
MNKKSRQIIWNVVLLFLVLHFIQHETKQNSFRKGNSLPLSAYLCICVFSYATSSSYNVNFSKRVQYVSLTLHWSQFKFSMLEACIAYNTWLNLLLPMLSTLVKLYHTTRHILCVSIYSIKQIVQFTNWNVMRESNFKRNILNITGIWQKHDIQLRYDVSIYCNSAFIKTKWKKILNDWDMMIS